MRPLRLYLENIHSYRGPHELDLSNVALAVLSGDNGSGKTTIAVDVSRFVLYGQTRHGLNSIIADGEDYCRAEMEFMLGNERYLISRSRSSKGAGKTSLSFQLLGTTPIILDGKTVAETQGRIERTLRMTDELFIATACAMQGDSARFTEAKPAARKEVLADILDLERWLRRAEVSRHMARDLAAQNKVLEARAVELREAAAQVKELRESIEQIEQDIEAAEGTEGECLRAANDATAAKVTLLQEQAADEVQRQVLTDLERRVEVAQADVTTQGQAVSRLETDISGKERLTEHLASAEAAETIMDQQEKKHVAMERLEAQLTSAQDRLDGVIATHNTELKTLRDRIAATRVAYDQRVVALRDRIRDREAQAAPLENIPCAGTKYEAECPLIELARDARDKLPDLRTELQAEDDSDPVAEDSKVLADLEAMTVGKAEVEERDGISARLDDLEYDEHLHKAATEEAAKIGPIRKALVNIAGSEARLEDAQGRLVSAKKAKRELDEQVLESEAELGPARHWKAELAKADASIDACNEDREEAQEKLDGHRTTLATTEERLRAAVSASADADDVLETLSHDERRVEVFKALVRAFGRDGIPALLIEQAIPELEDVANDMLATLSDGRMSLLLESQRETLTRTVSETLDIVVSLERGPMAYESLSGGEAMRVDLAIRMGLSALLSGRSGAKVDFLSLDEVCAAVDQEGQDFFVECLQRLRSQVGLILCSTHIERLKDAFPVCINVAKGSDGSRFEVVHR